MIFFLGGFFFCTYIAVAMIQYAIIPVWNYLVILGIFFLVPYFGYRAIINIIREIKKK